MMPEAIGEWLIKVGRQFGLKPLGHSVLRGAAAIHEFIVVESFGMAGAGPF